MATALGGARQRPRMLLRGRLTLAALSALIPLLAIPVSLIGTFVIMKMLGFSLNNLSLFVAPGEMRAIIGPNGAGKTTLFNCLSRLYACGNGDILFDGQSILQLPTHRIAALGIGRGGRYFAEGFLAVKYGEDATRYLLQNKLQFTGIVLLFILASYFVSRLILRPSPNQS